MMTLFSVGLPVLALGALIPLYLAWETVLSRFPTLEPLLMKAAAFNLFKKALTACVHNNKTVFNTYIGN